MRIGIVSKANRHGGGASRVAEDLAIWLNQSGHITDHFISYFQGESLPFQRSLYGENLSFKLCKKIHSVTGRFGFRELLPVEYWFSLRKILDEYDVIHFHDLYTAISPLTLALVSQHKPTFFTVHDCSPFTGGCLYPMECDKFSSYCHQCPQLCQNTWKSRLRDRSKEIQSIKRWVAKNFQIRYIFPSEWIQTKHNGILVEPTNQEALNQALRQALLSTNLLEMGQQARRDVETKFSHTMFLERHLQLYQEVT